MVAVASSGVGPVETGRNRWLARLRRFAKITLLGNLALVTVIAVTGVAAHRWATSSEDHFEQAIGFAQQYVLVPARLIEDYHVKPAAVESLVGLIELVVIDAAGRGPRHDAHLYWQGRVLMAMPAVYKRLGQPELQLARWQRAIDILADLGARNPAITDYRRRLAVSYSLRAADLTELGRHELALDDWKSNLAVAEQLAREEPGHWRWRWYIAGAELTIAQSLMASGQRDGIGARVEKAHTISRQLCLERPEDGRLCKLASQAEQMSAGVEYRQ